MKPLSVLGIGCVSPLGASWPATCARLASGETASAATLEFGGRTHPVFRAPVPDPPANIAARVRRSSAISHFACAAAGEAWQAAGCPDPSCTALVLAASDGAVIYTRRFYEDVMHARPASPLLFPETVYNAPASHIAALLDLDGEVLTCVGDATAAVVALATAGEILDSGSATTCLVVAAEELDGVTCEAYRQWGLSGPDAAILSEGAVALVLGHSPASARIDALACRGEHPLRIALAHCITDVEGTFDSLVRSRSGSRMDLCEDAALGDHGTLPARDPKRQAGEAFAVSALLQVALAADSCEGTSLVTLAGWNGQAAAVRVTRS